jgi:hypothetical protein
MAQRSVAKTWKDLIGDIIERLPRDFSLSDVLDYESRLASSYPANRNIDAKVRQTLQILRDQGVVEFLGKGRYRRLNLAPEISPAFDCSVASRYLSRSQMARVMIETWVELSLYCLRCRCDRLRKLPDNTPLSDFVCPNCDSEYQVKSKNGRFQNTVPGAQYSTVIAAVRAGTLPEHFLAEYDVRYSTLVWVRAIPGSLIVEDRIAARKPLSPTARRKGWVGCTINIANLPFVSIIAPQAQDRKVVRSNWSMLTPA